MKTRVVTNTNATLQVVGVGATIDGFYVSSTTSGVFKLINGTTETESGDSFFAGNLTPAAGFHSLAGMDSSYGLYMQPISGSINISFFIRTQDI